jgi:hypothetical protein
MYNITIYRNKSEWRYIIAINKTFLPEGKDTDEYIHKQFKKEIPIIESESIYGVMILELKPHKRYRISLTGKFDLVDLVNRLDSEVDNIIMLLDDNDDIELWEVES